MSVPWGSGRMTLELPPHWRLAGVLEPSGGGAVADVAAEVRRAISEPIGGAGLGELARPGCRIALVMDDASRPTPVSLVLPAILDALGSAGARRSDITLVTALGLHRPMSESEIAQRAGPGVLSNLRWENHDCDDPTRLVALGRTSRRTPVMINRTVAQADLVVAVGCIEPHIIASFGGGYKNLVPGVAGRATIAASHALNCTPATFAMTGQPVERNPMRLDLEEAGRMIRPPVFIVNTVLNGSLRVVRVVAGDPVGAQRAGAAICAGIYAVRLDHPVDVVITNSHPMDQDLRQGVKALANAVPAVRPGGVLITLVRAEEGVGVFGLAEHPLPLGQRALRALAPLLLRLVPRIRLGRLGEEDRFFLYFALQAIRRTRLLLFAPTIPAAARARLPFVEFMGGAAAAIERAREFVGDRAEVIVFPEGGATYPLLGSD